MTDEDKKKIDSMTHHDLCMLWRFGTSWHPLLQGDTGEYVKSRLFDHFGGFTPQISKSIGWGP